MSKENDISKVVDQIIKRLEAKEWSSADRLQKVLEELVKIQVAEIQAGKL